VGLGHWSQRLDLRAITIARAEFEAHREEGGNNTDDLQDEAAARNVSAPRSPAVFREFLDVWSHVQGSSDTESNAGLEMVSEPPCSTPLRCSISQQYPPSPSLSPPPYDSLDHAGNGDNPVGGGRAKGDGCVSLALPSPPASISRMTRSLVASDVASAVSAVRKPVASLQEADASRLAAISNKSTREIVKTMQLMKSTMLQRRSDATGQSSVVQLHPVLQLPGDSTNTDMDASVMGDWHAQLQISCDEIDCNEPAGVASADTAPVVNHEATATAAAAQRQLTKLQDALSHQTELMKSAAKDRQLLLQRVARLEGMRVGTSPLSSRNNDPSSSSPSTTSAHQRVDLLERYATFVKSFLALYLSGRSKISRRLVGSN